ncbi:unnamed protein product [Angiostrongylus costaricensis]|uniref:Translation initiation factor eIF2B subunit gamma n=1 Tax=Angiostrongylus costaricensis TaxID=334426 RepID=A0A0R3PG68_ANGCS|nr:unnamed protein product [Angiostrongylus costaricensis]
MLKCLLPIANVPMFWYPLNTLVNSGVKDIKLFVREDGESEVSRLLATSPFSYPSATIEVISVSRENEEWGTADLLRHYASRITHDFIVMSCDFISDCRLQPMVDQFRAHSATLLCLLSDMCITGPVPGPKVRRSKARFLRRVMYILAISGRDFIALEESTSRIVYMTNEEDFDQPVNADSWLNKFSSVTLTANYVDCHVYFMSHACLGTLIEQKNFSSLKADLIPHLLSKQCSLSSGDDEMPKCMAYLLSRGNATIAARVNNLGAYLETNKSVHGFILKESMGNVKGVLKSLPRFSSLLYTGRVFDGRSTGIHANESLVAEDSEVGERVLIKKSVIASRCSVGEKANIQGSLLMEGSTIGRG